MSKKIILFSGVVIFFLSYHFAFASLVINEIMYNPQGLDTDHEWIEIFNNSSTDSVDITGWKFNDGSNHGLNQPPANGGQGSLVIPAGAYAILSGNAATFLSDHLGFSGTVIDTVMSLPNTSGTLELHKADNSLVDTVSYNSSQGANEDGNSLQKIGTSWSGATPTPGAQNSNPSITPSGGSGLVVSDNSANNISLPVSATTTATTAETKTKVIEIPKIKTEIIGKTSGFAGLPILLEAKAYGPAGEQLYFGKYFWNFGDGDSKEINLSDSRPFTHAYFYPGEYAISLDYYQNYYSNIPDASNQITIRIVPVDISISRVGDDKDFFVEISNNTDYTADLSNWSLTSEEKSFMLPHNTTLASKKKLIISPQISHFSWADKNTLKLMTPEKEVAFDYEASVTPSIPPPKGEAVKSSLPFGEGKGGVNFEVVPASVLDNQISTNNLTASIVESDAVNSKNPNAMIFSIISIIFVGISALGVYLVRQKGTNFSHGNDFEILDE